MVIQLKFPEQIQVASEGSMDCESLSSNVDDSIECFYFAEQDSIIVSNAFNTILYDQSQGLIFSIGMLKNPDTL